MYQDLATLHMAYGLPEAIALKLSWGQWNNRLKAAMDVLVAFKGPMV
jgi:hypothetical protein